MSFLERTEMLIDSEQLNKIKNAKILLFGVGGVGGACAEALVRAGISNIAIVDADTVSESNKNRQIIALDSTIGKKKTEVMKNRLLDINSECNVEVFDMFYAKDTYHLIDLSKYDYIIDCIDTVTSKIHIISECTRLNKKFIVSTGTGNRIDPTKFYITDIYKTEGDPLAKVLRKELKDRRIPKCKVLASKELPIKVLEEKKIKDEVSNRNVPGSISFVPPVAGMIIASYVFNDLIK